MKRIPVGPLRAFDVAARNLNLSAAAEEMNVTHAAVSRQVKQLEERLGVKLFERLPRGLKLTAHGALLAEGHTRGVRSAGERARGRVDPGRAPQADDLDLRLAVGALADAARQAFSSCFPDVDLQVITTTRLVDFAREDVDIGIRFGAGRYPGLHVVPLFKPREIVVCSPELLKRGPPLKTFADLRNHTLLHDDSHRVVDPLARRRGRQRRQSASRHHLRRSQLDAAGGARWTRRRHRLGSVCRERSRSGPAGEGVRYGSRVGVTRSMRCACRGG